nr:MAG TPA: Portal protein [Bacteriophage sp.]
MKRDELRKLKMWQDRLETAREAIQPELNRMGKRESIYDGDPTIYAPDGSVAKKGKATHVRNVGFELIETQVESDIPSPKVTAIRQEDEWLADIAENLLRNVMDKLPFERINDEGERISPVQGGHGLLVDWQAGISGKDWLGDLRVTMMHPRGIIPQANVSQISDMDWIFLESPATRRQIKEAFGVALEENENESDPDARRLGDSPDNSGEIVTLVTCYYRNSKGGIGRYRWVNDTVVEDLEDYQVRRVNRCGACGMVGDGHRCRYCQSTKFTVEVEEFEELTEDIVTRNGTTIPATSEQRDEYGQPVVEPLTEGEGVLPQLRSVNGPAAVTYMPVMAPTRIPYYKPDVYPIVVRKNVSKFGRFMGGSDIDAIADQQNTMNQLSTKIKAKVLGGGSFTTLPETGAQFVTDEDNRVVRVDSPAKMQMIHTFNTQVDIQMDLALRAQIYEEARQTIGITDSMQGRKDPTATSAVAKEFSAQQAAGRLESKRVMKRAMYQDLFEVIFKFFLAYCEEPRWLHKADENGRTEYLVFDRHDFLYQDEAGEWKYNTDFLFSCDSAAPLATDRQALWKEARMNFQQGAMGPVNEITTLLRFWTQMEKLHYPMAGDMRRSLEEELGRQQEAAQQQQAAAAAMQGGADTGAAPAMDAAMMEGGGMA